MTSGIVNIHDIIDNALAFTLGDRAIPVSKELLSDELIDFSRDSGLENTYYWKAVPAMVSQVQFERFEAKIGIRLPESYKVFLGYKHFVHLGFGHVCGFFPHKITWIEDYMANIWASDIEETLDKKIVPFAEDENGTGYFCFDAREQCADNEYRIVTFDRTFGIGCYPSIKQRIDFFGLLIELNNTLEEWKRQLA